MQIEGSANHVIVHRIEDIVKEQYDESAGLLLNISTTHVDLDRVYIVQIVVAYENDDENRIHTETLRVDDNGLSGLEFTILSEHDLDLRNA